ncbi:HAD family hydrolase [Modestobacter sp. SSW1-42]|uniref:HAD family hydrolase n=1 Tax=Modestobacter sp. SSW1-42 TaxID=596372 RepID=UPI00398610B6
MTRTLIASDLDRTLIYSAAAAPSGGLVADPDGPGATGLVAVERYEGRDISFMTPAAATALAALAAREVVVPVTTRTPAQLARVRLPGPAPRYAIAANGGVLLVDGVPDPVWAARVAREVAAVAPLSAVLADLTALCRPEWAGRPRIAADLFCSVVVDRPAVPAGVVERLTDRARAGGWSVSLQGRKIYLVPQPLQKSTAAMEVARRVGADVVLAAGDSLLDVDLLAAADRAVRPGHGEIAASGWSAPWVDALTSTGAAAGEEIVAWFAAHTGSVPPRDRPDAQAAVR